MNKKRFFLIAPTLLFTITALGACSSSNTFTVKFNTDGGTAISDVQVKKGEKVGRPATDPSKDGYTFINWFDAPKGTGGANLFNFDSVINADTTIYAHYTPISAAFDFSKNPITINKDEVGQAQIAFKDIRCIPTIESITWTIEDTAKLEKVEEATDHMYFKFKGKETTGDDPTFLKVVVKTKPGPEFSNQCAIYIQ